MRIRTVTVAAALLLAALTACSSGGTDSKSKAPAPTPSPKASKLAALAPVWQPKLDAAADGSAATCMTPSSHACAAALTDIMLVVGDIEDEIAAPGRGPYPESTAQIAKMQEASDKYVAEGCKGDPAADDPNSQCWGIADITIGATTLGMTLTTDDMHQ